MSTPPASPGSPEPSMPSFSGTLMERMGIEVLDASPDGARGTMPVTGNTQPYGLLHGGASAVLAETLGSVAATAHAQTVESGAVAVGIELGCTHHRAAMSGVVTGAATVLSRGRHLASYEIVVEDDQHRRICTARLTCMIRPASSRTDSPRR